MNKLYNIFLTIFLCGFLMQSSYGFHIIGGEVTYECLGNDRYEITFIMYRDCSTSQGAEFDSAPGASSVGTVTIYRDDILDEPYIRTINLDAPEVTTLDPSEANPCKTIPPNVCVEKGVYKFEVELPQSSSSYHVVYQRCCRNTTIINIEEPGSVGGTYQVEITPEAQNQCIDSPVFDRFPPIVICSGFPLVVDQSVSDDDPNTRLEYSLCAPYVGGGRLGTMQGENAEAPNGVTPNPDTRPPYDEVDYNAAYDAENPLNASPSLSINPTTGVISGTPTTVGQYVVGVCVKQFKNGELLTEIKRDFQFNVTECIPKVNADLVADEQEDDEYYILQCGDNTVNFENLSTDEDFIQTYDWEFYVDGNIDLRDTRDVTYTFPDTGVYEVKMILNKDIDACNDSARITVEVRDNIYSRHMVMGDSCDATSVTLTNSSYSENGPITSYSWFFEEGNTSNEELPDLEFQNPGNKNVFLAVEDEYGCMDTSFTDYGYFPRPSVVDVSLIQDLLCTRTSINVENNSSPIDSTYQVNWYLSNGEMYTGLEPIFEFDEAAELDLVLEIISPIGCIRTDTFSSFFDIEARPYAEFDYSPKELSQFQKRVEFTNNSRDADSYLWEFDDDGTTMQLEPSFTFPDTGYKEVNLYAFSDNGCIDTATQILDVVPLATYFLPTAFSPDRDGINDGYRGEGYFPFIRDFTLSIYTRWGEKVFETNDPLESWNGQYHNSGRRMPQGVYVVQVKYRDPRGNVFKKKEFATLLD